jgi:hypothetical protein
MADMDDTFQVEMRRRSRQVAGINGRSGTQELSMIRHSIRQQSGVVTQPSRLGNPARVRGAIPMDWQVKWEGQEKALATFAPRIP